MKRNEVMNEIIVIIRNNVKENEAMIIINNNE